ncbi:hypothetical protein [Oryzifoliimicrobium ureilyticus]|uniref:hypothetical protein n=1 Tax=Oryzifoliimicrobium ureilyticus TaxID=3113724 RepID=UPI003076622F
MYCRQAVVPTIEAGDVTFTSRLANVPFHDDAILGVDVSIDTATGLGNRVAVFRFRSDRRGIERLCWLRLVGHKYDERGPFTAITESAD